MASDVTMPRLSDSMEEGTIIKWIVSEGDEVERGQPLVEIETDKANMTYDSDSDGTLIEIVAGEGDTLPIGEVIARIGDASEARDGDQRSGDAQSDEDAESSAGDAAEAADEREQSEAADGASAEEEAESAEGDEGQAEAPDGATAEEEAESAEGDEGQAQAADGATAGEEAESRTDDEARADSPSRGTADSDGGERVRASPVARRMAREMGVELSAIAGSGPGGRIVKADVEGAAKGEPATARSDGERESDEAPDPGEGAAREAAEPERTASTSKGEVRVEEPTRTQRTIARRMAESKATAPDFQLEVEIDMGRCVELRRRLRELAEEVPSYNDMIVKACAGALRELPRVNAAYRDGHFELYSRVNVGVAVAARESLIVPTVFDADKKSLGEVSRTVRELVAKVRDGKITPPELSGATFTVSNLGMYGIDRFTAVINPPQAAILAVGALKTRPAVDESGRIVPRDLMRATLCCDHRILYGADGAEYLARVRELLEQPLSLAL